MRSNIWNVFRRFAAGTKGLEKEGENGHGQEIGV